MRNRWPSRTSHDPAPRRRRRSGSILAPPTRSSRSSASDGAGAAGPASPRRPGRSSPSARRSASTPAEGATSTAAARVVEAGPWAIEAYVEEPLETRFIQSFKSYAASPLFQETRILGRRYEFRGPALRLPAAPARPCRRRLAAAPRTCIVGRPVNFAGLRPDPALALARYQTAFARLGFSRHPLRL